MDFLSADIKVVEAPPSAQVVPSIPTAVGSVVGVTERGPFGSTLVTSWPEWQKLYGGFTAANPDVAAAAYAFFANGGKFLYTVRVVHYTNLADPTTKTSASSTGNMTTTGAATQGEVTSGNVQPFALEPGDHLDLNVDGAAEPVVTFNATAGSRVGSGGTFPTLFTGGETLQIALDGGVTQTISFSAGDQTAVDVVNRINSNLSGGFAAVDTGEVRVTSDKKGTGSRCAVIGGSGAATLGLSVGFTDGTGNVANIAAVTGAEVKSLVEAATTAEVTVESGGEVTFKTPTVGASGSIQVLVTSTVDDAAKLDLDNSVHSGSAAGSGNTASITAKSDGVWGDNLSVQVSAASSGVSTEFNLAVLLSGASKESFVNLTMDPTSPRYLETIVNNTNTGSTLLRATDLHAGVAPTNRPTNGTYALSGGNDGLVGLVDGDFTGNETGPTGLYQLDRISDVTILAVPGRATVAVHQAMVDYCETHRNGSLFPVLDPPAGYSATQIRDYVRTTAALYERSEFGAIYWPRLKVQNPDTSVLTSDEDGLVTVPPSGHVMGVYARVDGSTIGGVHQPPAGPERSQLKWCIGVENEEALDPRKRDVVYPANINPICPLDGVPIHLDGNRCLKTSGNWGYVSERRGMTYIERAIKTLLVFVRHSNNDTSLRRRCYRTVDMFLRGETKAGAFRTKNPKLAYWIDFSDALNPPSAVLAHKLYGRVAVAKAKSIDWAIIEIAEDTRALEAELAK